MALQVVFSFFFFFTLSTHCRFRNIYETDCLHNISLWLSHWICLHCIVFLSLMLFRERVNSHKSGCLRAARQILVNRGKSVWDFITVGLLYICFYLFVFPLHRGATLIWLTGCSTAFGKLGSLPPNTTWPTSRSSSQNSSTSPSSCSTPITLTWVAHLICQGF